MPLSRAVLYNRISAERQGTPTDEPGCSDDTALEDGQVSSGVPSGPGRLSDPFRFDRLHDLLGPDGYA
jgi:hypothetical protein